MKNHKTFKKKGEKSDFLNILIGFKKTIQTDINV